MKRFFCCALVLAVAFAAMAEVIELKSGASTCRVDADDGARVVSWAVDGDERLWMPETRATDGKWRHGGIPLCWPWICDGWPKGASHSPHGLAWCGRFSVKDRKTDRTGDRVTLSFAANGLTLDYSIAVRSNELCFALCTRNASAEPKPLQFSIHPYLRVENRDWTTLAGVDGLRYHDTREGKETNGVWKGESLIFDTLDHEFFRGTNGAPMCVSLYEDSGRLMRVRSDDADMTVVWNPGPSWPLDGTELYGGLASNVWRRFVSVEPSIRPRTLRPGETHRFAASFAAEGPTVHAQRAPGVRSPLDRPLEFRIRGLQIGCLKKLGAKDDPPVVLVKGGRPMLPILIRDDARDRQAAQKLADVIFEMTGARPTILVPCDLKNRDQVWVSHAILIGRSGAFKRFFPHLDESAPGGGIHDGFVSRSGNIVFDMGDPVAAVDSFCEEVLGVREKDGKRQVVQTDGLSVPQLIGFRLKADFVVHIVFATTVVLMLLAILVFWIFERIGRKPTALAKMPFGKALLEVLVTSLWLLPAMSALEFAIELIGRAFGWEFPPQQFTQLFSMPGLSPAANRALVLMALVEAPLLEELLFRRFLFRCLLGHMRMAVAAVVSGAIFSFVHGDVAAFVPLWIFGIVQARVYYRTGRLSCAILLHFLLNLLAVTILWLGWPV